MPRQLARDLGTSLKMGSTTFVTTPGTTPTVTTGITICAWVNSDLWLSKYTAASTARIIRTTDDNIDLFTRQTGPNLEWKLTTTQGSTPRPTTNERYLSPNTWHFIVCQYDKTTALAEMYIDNAINSAGANPQQTRDGTNLSSNNIWSVGDTAGTAAFRGLIDEVQVFDSAFSSAQRDAAYYSSVYPSTGRVFYYKFDEGSGTTALDSSGNGKDGAITSGTYVTNSPMKARVSAGSTPRARAEKLRVSEASPDIEGHNGVTTDGTYVYTMGNAPINKYIPSPNWAGAWTLAATNQTAASQAGVAHLGDGAYNPNDGLLYIAAEDYTSPVEYSHQRIAVFRASDLSLVATHDISAQAAEVSGLALDIPRGLIYVSSYVQSDKVYQYSLTDFTYQGYIQLSRDLPQTQCIAYKNNTLYIGENVTNRIYKADLGGQVLNDYVRAVKTNQEGVDYVTDTMLVLDEQNTQQVVWRAPGTPNRLSLGSNIVYNGDFSRQPLNNTNGTTTDDRWVDGTTTGSYITFAVDSHYGWATNNSAFASSAQFDTSKGYNAMLLSSVSAGTNMEVAPYSSDTVANRIRYGIPASNNTSYTLSFDLETELISGDSNDGAYIFVREYGTNGATLATNSSSKIKISSSKTTYTLTYTTNIRTQYMCPVMSIIGNSGAGTLNIKAWFSNLSLVPTTAFSRSLVS